MERLIDEQEELKKLVLHQLKAHWIDIDEKVITAAVPGAVEALMKNFEGLPNRRFYDGKNTLISPYITVQWAIFLYRLSCEIFEGGGSIAPKEAEQVYYLNKILHSNDWFYAINLPKHFLCEHPLGSVLGRAKYGDYLFVYQGTTVGGNRSGSKLYYPILGNNVTLYANATVLGNTHIGNNVLVSSNTYIINDIIPDNCIVFGHSPNLTIKRKSEEEIKRYTSHIWGWR